MKPLYTILIILTMLSNLASAQNSNQSNSNTPHPSEKMINSSGEKLTRLHSRWYCYYDFIDALIGNTMSGGQYVALPMWHDPGMLLGSSISGTDTVNCLSIAQIIDPVSSIYSSDTDLMKLIDSTVAAGNVLQVGETDGYMIDSISIVGNYYIAKPLRTTADSLIISITPNIRYYKDTAGWITSYGITDSLIAFAPRNVDSIHRCAYSDTIAVPGKTWAVPLTTAMAAGVTKYKFAPPGGPVYIPAGYHAAITVTFKSTDSWVKNVDSITEFNCFTPLFGYEYPYPSGGYMTYWRNTYSNDCHGSSLMHNNDSAHYIPAIIEQGKGLPATKFSQYEYADVGAHVVCITCGTADIKDVPNSIKTITAYPNPANNELTIPIVLSRPEDIEIELINAAGQVLQTKSINGALNEKVTFNTKSLSQGVYFYSVKAGNEQQSGRIVIVHQ
jgi:hypothetical protein